MPIDDCPHVLVVDDESQMVSIVSFALETEGFATTTARSAEEAWLRFEMAVPDAVLLDCVMPGEDGFALCRRLKAEASWAHVPVIFMTGLSETEQIVQGFASGGLVQPIGANVPRPTLGDASAPTRTVRVELAAGGQQVTATVDGRDEARLLQLLDAARARTT